MGERRLADIASDLDRRERIKLRAKNVRSAEAIDGVQEFDTPVTHGHYTAKIVIK